MKLALYLALLAVGYGSEPSITLLDGRTFKNASVRVIGRNAVIESDSGRIMVPGNLLPPEIQAKVLPPPERPIELDADTLRLISRPISAQEVFRKLYLPAASAAEKLETETMADYQARLATFNNPSQPIAVIVEDNAKITYNPDSKEITIIAGYVGELSQPELTVEHDLTYQGQGNGTSGLGISVKYDKLLDERFLLSVKNFSSIPSRAKDFDSSFGSTTARLKITAPLLPADYSATKENLRLVILISDAKSSGISSENSHSIPRTSDPTETQFWRFKAQVLVRAVCLVDVKAGNILERVDVR